MRISILLTLSHGDTDVRTAYSAPKGGLTQERCLGVVKRLE
jgi:hypothetical protein